MIAYLESDAPVRPRSVAFDTVLDEAGPTGRLTSTIQGGELFLHPKGEKEKRYRLHWSPDDTERAVPLPVGTYVVTGYRHIETAKDGSAWIWASTSPKFREIEVKAGETTHCAVRRALRVKTRAFEKKGKHRVSLAFLAEKRLGHTLYRDGKRIVIRWECLDLEGEVLAEGVMRYG